MEPVAASLCGVCQQNERKYKCKTCQLAYCSVPCYKRHQEQPCSPPAPELAIQDDPAPTHLPFTTVDTVAPEKLELLAQSDELRQLLCNPHLRRLLTEIDRSRNGNNAVRVAMMEPLFVEFADVCMKLTEPPTDEPEQDPSALAFPNRRHSGVAR